MSNKLCSLKIYIYDILKIKSGTQGRIKWKIQNQDKTKTIKITEKR